MKKYFELVRVKHWMKNLSIFFPIFFAGQLFEKEIILKVVIGFFAFSLMASAIYIINDMKDIELDRQHPTKCKRPLASGKVKTGTAVWIAVMFAIFSMVLNVAILKNGKACGVLLLYAILNILYSIVGLKKFALVDILILCSGFSLRVFYGSVITEIPISAWLYLVVISGSFYLALGKRRNEIQKLAGEVTTRDVLKDYSFAFLDKNMNMCMTLMIVFYSLWCMDSGKLWTVPILITIVMKYSMDVEGDSDGDPVEVILRDKWLVILATCYVVVVFGAIYF